MFTKNKNHNGETKEIPMYGVIDERTKSIVYQGDAYTGRFMLFAVLIDVVIRGLNLNNSFIDSNWDLMLIVIVGGMISTIFQVKNKVMLSRPFSRSFIFIASIMGLSALLALLATFFFPR